MSFGLLRKKIHKPLQFPLYIDLTPVNIEELNKSNLSNCAANGGRNQI